jgi:hypothetical protein
VILTPDQRQRFLADTRGKTIKAVAWIAPDPHAEAFRRGYYVVTFTDDTELSIRLMAEEDDRRRAG